MQKSEIRRKNDLERQKENFTTLACAARKDEGKAFRAWCAERGISVHAALLSYVRQCIGEEQADV